MDQVNNVTRFLNILEKYSSYSEIFFRGQSSEYPNITSSVTRDQGYLEYEYAIYADSINMKIDEFKTLAHPFQRLSKLQHFGIPTRLIDVTIDPLIALFFAIQNTESEHDGIVYVYT